MSDKRDGPAPGAEDHDPILEISREDLDALLAQVDSLTAEVEQEVGGPEPATTLGETASLADAEEPAELAKQIEEQVRRIEHTADAGDAGVADAAQAAAREPPSDVAAPQAGASEDPAGSPVGAEAGTEGIVVEDDHLDVEREIASILEQPIVPGRTASMEVAEPPAARRARWPAICGVCWRYGVLGLGWVLEQADRPFVNWSAERKRLIGYVALATLFMAVVTCLAAVFFKL